MDEKINPNKVLAILSESVENYKGKCVILNEVPVILIKRRSPASIVKDLRQTIERCRAIVFERGFRRMEKRRPNVMEGYFKRATLSLDRAELLLHLIPKGASNFSQFSEVLAFNELTESVNHWIVKAFNYPYVVIGHETVQRQRKANEARNTPEKEIIKKTIQTLARWEDHLPSELWPQFYGELDILGLDPVEHQDRIEFDGGSIRYDAFRKRIIRYRK